MALQKFNAHHAVVRHWISGKLRPYKHIRQWYTWKRIVNHWYGCLQWASMSTFACCCMRCNTGPTRQHSTHFAVRCNTALLIYTSFQMLWRCQAPLAALTVVQAAPYNLDSRRWCKQCLTTCTIYIANIFSFSCINLHTGKQSTSNCCGTAKITVSFLYFAIYSLLVYYT